MATIFQTKEWEEFKLKTGYEKSWRVFDLLVLQRKIPLLGSMLYTPMVSRDQTKLATQKIFLDQIKKIAKESKSIFYRLESTEENPSDINLKDSKYIKAFEEMQPEHTLLLDISKTEEEILSQMKQKGRYNIKVAEKHNIRVTEGKVEDFYKLYKEMARRQKITFRNLNYFQNLVDILGKKDYIKVFVASAVEATDSEGAESQLPASASQTKILASAIVIFYQNKAIYLYGGSSQELKGYMAPYKLHFEIIKEAKRRDCKTYDFFGIAPNDDPKHPWAGISRFKRQFGGEDFASLGSWDLILSPIKYKLFKLAEKIRRK